MLALGLMSGTSADGVDAAVIETDGSRVFATGAFLTLPMPGKLRQDLLADRADQRSKPTRQMAHP